jgi:hypothetical protein
MSFLNKIKKGWGQSGDHTGDVGVMEPEPPYTETFTRRQDERVADLPLPDMGATAPLQVPAMQQTTLDSSIISEAAPSELADYSETRLQDGASVAGDGAPAVPLIGNRPVAQQQRILVAMIVIGVVEVKL